VTVRLCVDFKKINAITGQILFYMPRVEVLGVGKAEFISKLDLSKGYYQIPMKDEDVGKTFRGPTIAFIACFPRCGEPSPQKNQ